MDDKQAKNSWDDLLQDLGAKPDESAFERQQAPDQEIPPTVEWSEAEESTDETEASPGDWNSLAESLGLEVEESAKPVEEPVVAKDEPPAKAEVKEPVAEKIVEEVVGSNDPAEESFGGFAAPEESSFEEVTEDDDADDYNTDDGDVEEASTSDDELPPLPSPMEQALSETAWEDDAEEKKSEKASDDGDDDDDSEGISGEAARSAFDALFSDGASGWGSAFLPKRKKEDKPRAAKRELVDDTIDADLSESLDAKTDTDGEDEETERPKRKRSRRRRRGGRGRKSASERAGAEGESSDEQSSADSDDQSDDPSDEILAEEVSTDEAGEKKARRPRRRRSGQRSRPVEASDESGVDDNDDDKDLIDGEEGADEDHPRGTGRGRQLHRNLPTWSDAIGMIVDANLEQRAKSPSKPQSSRGGRGRGGRGRRRKSPESK